MLMVDLDQTLIHTTEQHCQQMSNKVSAGGTAVLGRSLVFSLGSEQALPLSSWPRWGTVESWWGLEWTLSPTEQCRCSDG